MAEFNSCASLMSDENVAWAQESYNKAVSPFNELLGLQRDLQADLHAKYPHRAPEPGDIKTKGELVDFLMNQKRAFDDEFQELVLSIAGTNKPEKDQSAIWKNWKSNYDKLRAEGVNEGLSQDEIHERNFEMIDMLHFVNNMLLALGLDEKSIYTYYMIKNLENFKRYKNQY